MLKKKEEGSGIKLKTHLNMPLSMKHSRAYLVPQGQEFGKLMLARDSHAFLVVSIAPIIGAQLLCLCEIVVGWLKFVICDDTKVVTEYLTKVTKSSHLLLMEI